MMQEFVQQVANTVKENMSGMHTAMPGTVVSFDTGTGLATVLPSMKYKKPDGTSMDFPQITGVPVVFPQGMMQSATVAFPVQSGDSCLIVVAEQSIDYWLYGQETSTDLAFDLTNAMCIPGLFSTANSVVTEACNSNAIIVDLSGTRITVKSGEVSIDASQVTVNAGTIALNGNVTVSGQATVAGDVTGSGISLAGHMHTGDSGGTTSSPD